jgi:hypothetical protein
VSAAAWHGTPWGPVDDPGELASMAADERFERAAKTAATPRAVEPETAPPARTLAELTAELNELRIRIEYADDDQAAVNLAQRIAAVLHEMVALTKAHA